MKHLKYFILEKFKLSSKNIQKYNYHPKDKIELMSNIREEITNQYENNIIDLNMIDVSNLTDLSYVFDDLDYNSNVDVSEWNVSKVKNFKGVFNELEEFNCDLSKWDVSSGRYFHNMFNCCKKFKGEGLDNWDITNAKELSGILTFCHEINFDYGQWFKQIKNKEQKEELADSLSTCKNISLDDIEKYL